MDNCAGEEADRESRRAPGDHDYHTYHDYHAYHAYHNYHENYHGYQYHDVS